MIALFLFSSTDPLTFYDPLDSVDFLLLVELIFESCTESLALRVSFSFLDEPI